MSFASRIANYGKEWVFLGKPGLLNSKLWRVPSGIVVATIGGLSKIWLGGFNRLQTHNKHILEEAAYNRSPNQCLVTVSNHASCIDDPLMFGILTWKQLFDVTKMRWQMAATEICFKSRPHSLMFSLGQITPVNRGEGVYQKCVDYLLAKLNAGHWVHMFPEGKVNMDQKEFVRLKWGVGRLIAETTLDPIVIPVWHMGMDNILPNHRPYIPRIGKKVTVVVGEPILFASTRKMIVEKNLTPREARKIITDKIQDEFKTLKKRAIDLHANRTQTR